MERAGRRVCPVRRQHDELMRSRAAANPKVLATNLATKLRPTGTKSDQLKPSRSGQNGSDQRVLLVSYPEGRGFESRPRYAEPASRQGGFALKGRTFGFGLL